MLPRNKIKRIRKKWQLLSDSPHLSIRKFSKFLGLQTPSIQAIFPATLHYRHSSLKKSGTEALPVLRGCSTSGLSGQIRDWMVERRLECLEWEGHYATTCPVNHRDRCLDQRFGCPLPGGQHRRAMVTSGERATRKLIRAPSVVTSSKHLCKRSGKGTHPASHRQCFSSGIYKQIRGNQFICTQQTGSGFVDMVPGQPNPPNHTTYPRGDQLPCRPGVQRFSGFQRLKSAPTTVSGSHRTLGSPWYIFFATRLTKQLPKICQLETRSGWSGYRCI